MPLEKTLQALADSVRRQILRILKEHSLTAGEISAAFPITDAAISRHLSVLKKAGLVTSVREGKYVRYSINTSVLEDALWFLMDLMGKKEKKVEERST